MTPRVVYDTNVVVSAALKAGSIPASLVTLALDRRVTPCLSPTIYADEDVVGRVRGGRARGIRLAESLAVSLTWQ